MTKKITIVIADDHPLFRKGLADTLRSIEDFALLGEAEDGATVLKLLEDCKPQVAVLDIEMPKMNGLDLSRALRERQPAMGIVILTMYKDPDLMDQTLNLGVRGYLVKDGAIREIVDCVRAVAGGNYYVSPILSTHLIHRKERINEFYSRYPAMQRLTPTEKEILKLIAMNKTSKEIAEALFISDKTVDNHRTNIVNKLDLHGKHQLLKFALEHRSFF